jgi:hypothetical protein
MKNTFFTFIFTNKKILFLSDGSHNIEKKYYLLFTQSKDTLISN